MATIGKIRVDLEGNTRGFRRSMKAADRQVVGFTRSLRGMLGPLTAVTGAFGFGQLARASADEALRVKQLSDRLDTNIERFSQLARVLQRSGIGLNQTGTILQRLQRRAAEAAGGNEKLQAVFAALGINVQDFINLDPVEAFVQLGEALVQVENPAERIRKAFALLDTEGVAALQADLAKLREELEKTAGITEDQAESVTKAAEAWSKLRESLSSAFLLAGEGLGIFQALTRAAEGFAKFVDERPSIASQAQEAAGIVARGNVSAAARVARFFGAGREADQGPPVITAPPTGVIGGGQQLVGGDLGESNRILRQIRDNTAKNVAVAQ